MTNIWNSLDSQESTFHSWLRPMGEARGRAGLIRGFSFPYPIGKSSKSCQPPAANFIEDYRDHENFDFLLIVEMFPDSFEAK